MAALTLGVVRAQGRALAAGPVDLLTFGEPEATDRDVTWPIEGGLLAAEAGGRLRLSASDSRLVARVEGYRPSLPLPLYRITQLPLHHALVRLALLRLRGRQPAAGVPADVSRRVAAGLIDWSVCAAMTLLLVRRRRLRAFAAIAAGYHVAAWSVSGRTIGGALMRQRVIAVDGSRPTIVQAVLRFTALPFAAIRFRAVHDEVAGTDVVIEEPPSP